MDDLCSLVSCSINTSYLLTFDSQFILTLLCKQYTLRNLNMLIDLPSSASAVDFPDNTNNRFQVRLPQKLILEPGQWEVGAMVAHIPNKFYNVVSGEILVESKNSGHVETFRITPGFYRTPDSLVMEIKREVLRWNFEGQSVGALLSLSYNKTTNKVRMDVAPNVIITFGDDLCGALGLAQGPHTRETAHVPRLCNMFYGLSYLFIYTNLVRGRLVGDTQSPLLRAIPVYGQYGDATHEFRHIHYTEAEAFNSDVVEVNIRTDTGELAPFVDGKVLLTLHLRPKDGGRK